MSEGFVSDGAGGVIAAESLSHLALGRMVTRDLARARTLYENFLGLEVAETQSGRALLRDRRAKYMMGCAERDFFVIEVAQRDSIERPQKMLNHWGFSVGSAAEVERLHAVAKARSEEFWIDKVRPITPMHGSYGFYFSDFDSNWWEIEFRSGKTNEDFFRIGYCDSTTRGTATGGEPQIASDPRSEVGFDGYLTHGTTDVFDIGTAQDFYVHVLGLRAVQHDPIAQFVAGGGDFAFVGVQVGKQIGAQGPENCWTILVDTQAMLRARHAKAVELSPTYNLKAVTDIAQDENGFDAFQIQTQDDNWFELTTRPATSLVEQFGKSRTE
jgi:catechol 2,3-dioxygenase-like lactoylglutathione lyase family enzyme